MPVYAVPVSSIGENIKRARKAAGFHTQLAFAEKLGVTQPQLSDWENDRYGAPDVKTLLRIAISIPCALDRIVQGLNSQYDASRDLIRHGSAVQPAPKDGGADDTAEARVRDLEGRLSEYEQLVGNLETVASELIKLAALGSRESRQAARAQRPRGRRDRKAS